MTTDDIAAIARQITYNSQKRVTLFQSLELEQRSVVFSQLSAALQRKLFKHIPLGDIVELLDHYDLQYAHVLVNRIENSAMRQRVIKRLKNERHQKIEQFLLFHPRAHRQLLHMNYVFVADQTRISDVAEVLQIHLQNTGKTPTVLVHEVGSLVGEVPLDVLVREHRNARIAGFVAPISTLPYNTSPEEVVRVLTEQPHSKVVVMDTDGSVLGVVFADDVIDLIGDAPGSSLFAFAGVESSERPFDTTREKVRHRYRWLILNLATAFLAGSVIAYFEDTLTRVAILAMYMPIIAGMGSNAATQTLAVMVRGISLGEISLANSYRAIVREVNAGFINGIITGGIVALVAFIFNHSLWLGVVAGVSVLASLIIAAFFGTLIPLVLKRYGQDPATSATIFITTGIDVFGFLIFFTLANLLIL